MSYPVSIVDITRQFGIASFTVEECPNGDIDVTYFFKTTPYMPWTIREFTEGTPVYKALSIIEARLRLAL